jgi:8-hydroxy-5-deazaflavin:NADPH oxidoreductase
MRIAVIGMGTVGSALGNRWAAAGQDVTFCVRDPGDTRKRADAEKMKAKIGPVSDAAKAEAVLLAVPWTAVPDALKAAGDLTGKVLLDCTNPVTPELTHLTIGHTTSAGRADDARPPVRPRTGRTLSDPAACGDRQNESLLDSPAHSRPSV